MITGIVSTDGNLRHLIELSPIMRSAMTNSYWFIRGICEDTNVVTDFSTWRMLAGIEEIPASVSTFINVDLLVIKSKFQLTPVTVIGNWLVEKQLPNLDRLIHIKYNEVLPDNKIKKNYPFPLTGLGKPNMLAKLPHFDLMEYVINENNYNIEL